MKLIIEIALWFFYFLWKGVEGGWKVVEI